MKPYAFLARPLARHIQVALNSLGRLWRAPAAAFLTTAVIGIALALPAGLYLLTSNLQSLGRHWDGGASLSLFLAQRIDPAAARELRQRLLGWPEIDAVQLITPEQALAEFRALSGFGDALELLDENPLPAVLAVRPTPAHAGAASAATLLQRLRALPEVDMARLDLKWVKRFNAILAIVRRAVLVMGALLALAVLLIVGNTIRLEIQNRHEEIEIAKLIGATNAFIRRPFLYTGLWYGLAGGLLATLLVEAGFVSLAGPVAHLAGLYDSRFALQALGLAEIGALLAGGASLGLAGAWLTVGRHLAAIEPA